MVSPRIHDDTLGEALAAHGVPVFADPPLQATPRANLEEVLLACLNSGRSRYRMAVIPLLLVSPEENASTAILNVAEKLGAAERRWLRWLALAATYLASRYKSELTMLLGHFPKVPLAPFHYENLPGPEVDFGEAGLTALSEEIAREKGEVIDWKGSLDAAVRDLLAALWTQRRGRAPTPHA